MLKRKIMIYTKNVDLAFYAGSNLENFKIEVK